MALPVFPSYGPNAGAQRRLMIIDALQTVHKKRSEVNLGFCTRCSSQTTKTCSNCGVFYCSKECQLIDWDKHQEACLTKNNIFRTQYIAGQSNLPLQQYPSHYGGSGDVLTSDTDQKNWNSFNKGSDESERRGDKPKNRSRFDDGFEGSSLTGNEKTGRNDDRNKSHDDKGARPRNRNRNEDSEKENFGSRNDCRNENRSKREPMAERDYKKDFNEPDESWERSDNTKSKVEEKSSPKESLNLPPRRRSPPPVIKNFESEVKKTECKPVEAVEVKKESSKLKQLKVIGLIRESKDSYWVLEEEDIESWQALQESLQEVCKNAPSMKPEVGVVCGCFYDDMWYRGKIISIEPKIKVHCMDYGNTSECESNIKKLPGHLTEAPGLAFLIKFDKGTPVKYENDSLDGDGFAVEIVKETDAFYLIRFVGEDYSAAEVEEEKKEQPKKRISAQARLAALRKPKRRNIWDSVKEDVAGLLHITSGIGRTVYGCLIPETDEEAVLCFDQIADLNIPKEPGISPKIGDFVLASNGKELVGRGEVLCKAGNSYIVNLVDYAQCAQNKEVHPLPNSFVNYPDIGVKVHITESFLKSFDVKYVVQEETYFFVITGPCENNKWPCLIKTTDENPVKAASGFIEKWSPPVVQLSYMPIESGSSVLLSSLISLRTAYVRPASKECDDKLERISEAVSEYSSSAKKCKEPPSVGQMVCARFIEDGNYYRTVVESIEGDKFHVRFVDFGNDQLTKFDDLVPMPKELEEYSCVATKINLKNIEKSADCSEAAKYLSKLYSENKELIMTYDGNEVILKDKSGVVVNDYVKEKIAASRK